MKLEKMALPVPPAKGGQKGLLAVPVAAVLDSGTRHLVYVERGRGTFEAREVTLGPRCDGYFPVLKGLDEGERVVSRGGFLIDSQFQITGHPSLYYPGGLHANPERRDEAGPPQGTETPADARATPSPEAAIQPAGGHGH